MSSKRQKRALLQEYRRFSAFADSRVGANEMRRISEIYVDQEIRAMVAARPIPKWKSDERI